jgi:hypothetical protein
MGQIARKMGISGLNGKGLKLFSVGEKIFSECPVIITFAFL